MDKSSGRNHNRKDIAQYFKGYISIHTKKRETKLRVITKENNKQCPENRHISFIYKEPFKRNCYKAARKISKAWTDRWGTDRFHKQNTKRWHTSQENPPASPAIKEYT